MEFCPCTDVLNWANDVINTYPNKKVIIFIHMYSKIGRLAEECSAYGCCTGTDCHGGSGIWDNLIKNHPQIILVLSGHVRPSGAALIMSYVDGNPVHQIYQNWQWGENGGNGWLMYYTFYPTENKIQTKAYSPYLDQYDPQYEFELSLDMWRTRTSSSILFRR